MTALTYDLLAWQERQSIDDRTLGDLFYLMNEALPDLAFEEYLLTALKELKATVEQILDNFIKLLPVFMQKRLLQTA